VTTRPTRHRREAIPRRPTPASQAAPSIETARAQPVSLCLDLLTGPLGNDRRGTKLRAINVRKAQRILGNRAVQRLVTPGAGRGPAEAVATPRRGAASPDTAMPVDEPVQAAAAPVRAPPVAAGGGDQPATPGVEKQTTAAGPMGAAPATGQAQASVRAPSAAPTPSGETTSPHGSPSEAATAHVASGEALAASATPSDVAGDSTDGVASASADFSSGAGVLESLAAVPASSFAAAVDTAAGVVAALQAREQRTAQQFVPVIETPTGLPTVATVHTPPSTALPVGQAKGAPPAAAGKVAAPAPTPTTQAPLSGSQVSVAAAEPAATDDAGGSWWSWLVDRLHNFFGSLPTSDPNLSTSAGPRQRLALEGDADPKHNKRERAAGAESVQSGRAHADNATSGQFGEGKISPTVPRGRLRSKYQPAPPRLPGRAKAPAASELPASERAKFDQHNTPWVAAQVADQHSGYLREQAVYERTAKKAHEDGARQLAEENERTRADQVAMRHAAMADVAGARQRWRDENRKIETEYGDKATAKRRDIDREISQKVDATHRDADAAFDEAEKRAEAEKANSEAQATAKKREEEARPRSWWDRVKGAVSDAFDAIRSAVTTIFDKLRQVVKGIIDAAKKVVHTLIEAARSAIVGLIHGFGEFVKGLVTVALAAFPEAAAKARAWIDGRVAAATDAVNRAAKALESAADAILDGIGKAIDTALGVLQNALTTALDVLEKIALLPLQAMEALAKLLAWVEKNGGFVQSALKLESMAESAIEGLKNALGGMIAKVPAVAHAKLAELTASLGDGARIAAPAAATPATGGPGATTTARGAPGGTVVQRAAAAEAAPPAKRHVPASQHLAGVLRHLDKGLTYLRDHWWDELKKVGWNLLWPWPAVWGDLKATWAEVRAGFDDAYPPARRQGDRPCARHRAEVQQYPGQSLWLVLHRLGPDRRDPWRHLRGRGRRYSRRVRGGGVCRRSRRGTGRRTCRHGDRGDRQIGRRSCDGQRHREAR
jgi:hypothetical protein